VPGKATSHEAPGPHSEDVAHGASTAWLALGITTIVVGGVVGAVGIGFLGFYGLGALLAPGSSEYYASDLTDGLALIGTGFALGATGLLVAHAHARTQVTEVIDPLPASNTALESPHYPATPSKLKSPELARLPAAHTVPIVALTF
jgi:hypothetical protein